jgi:peroxiredoxin
VNAIAADPIDKAKELSDKLGGGLTLYSDLGLRVGPAWGAGKAGDEEPTPATYVVAADGTVRFEHHAGNGGDWPKVDDVIAQLPAR